MTAGAGVGVRIAVVAFWIPWPRLEPRPNDHLETKRKKKKQLERDGS